MFSPCDKKNNLNEPNYTKPNDNSFNKAISKFKTLSVIAAGLSLTALIIYVVLVGLSTSSYYEYYYKTLIIILKSLYMVLLLTSTILVSASYVNIRSKLLSESINNRDRLKQLKTLFCCFALILLLNAIILIMYMAMAFISIILFGTIYISYIIYLKDIKNIIPSLNNNESQIVQRRYKLKVRSLLAHSILVFVFLLSNYILSSMSVTYFTAGYKCSSLNELKSLLEKSTDNTRQITIAAYTTQFGIGIPTLNIKPKDEVSIGQKKTLQIGTEEISWKNPDIIRVRTNDMIVYYGKDINKGAIMMSRIDKILLFTFTSLFLGIIVFYFIMRREKQ